MEVVGYTYDAAVHCPKCTMAYARDVPYTEYVFGERSDEDITSDGMPGFFDMEKAIELEVIRDSEGNPIRPVFDTDEAGDSPDHCDDCHAFIDNSWSGETVTYVIDAFKTWIGDFMLGKDRDTETLNEWRDNLRNCIYDSSDERIIILFDAIREYEDVDD